MTAFKNIGSLIGVAATAAVGLTVGLAPASAAPTQSGANLVIYPDTATPGNYRIRVDGVFRMSEYDAHGFINNLNTGVREGGGGMAYTYKADDPGQFDSDITRPGWYPGAGNHDGGFLRAESDGIHYYQEISVPKSQLNEDPNYFDDNDEIYVVAIFIDGDGKGRNQVSNVITGLF